MLTAVSEFEQTFKCVVFVAEFTFPNPHVTKEKLNARHQINCIGSDLTSYIIALTLTLTW